MPRQPRQSTTEIVALLLLAYPSLCFSMRSGKFEQREDFQNNVNIISNRNISLFFNKKAAKSCSQFATYSKQKSNKTSIP